MTCTETGATPRFDRQRLEGASLPARLADLPEPPDQLFLYGNLPSAPCIGVVGTRDPSPEALTFASSLSNALAAQGIAVISGGAKGIDGAAHRGALAASGHTLVVAGSSLDCPFPAAHRGLFAEIIARGGGYLSRFEAGVQPRAHQFLDRNGILVALCDALVVVEAPRKSGARNAAAWARQLERPCFVVPSAPWNERGRGCIRELQLGALPLGDVGDILDWLAQRQSFDAPTPTAPRAARGAAVGTGEDALKAAVLQAVAGGARYADDVAGELGLDLPGVQHALLLLVLSGDVQQGPGGVLTTAPR
ncbi:MAG TPA: DNA-protecting protein DprA [Polyangiaceae bacterium]|nr:DNA-protecting protein DprA [Polyangiaceae bacterium]